MGAVDYQKSLEKEILECFNKELRKVRERKVPIEDLIAQIKELSVISEARAETSEFFDYKKVMILVAQSFFLLEHLDKYEEEVKNEVIAAISYFVNEEDAISDSDLVEGFDDDYEVMKTVVFKRKLGGPITK